MTEDETIRLTDIAEQLAAITSLLQTVVVGYDQRITDVEQKIAEIKGRCELRGGQTLQKDDNISSKFEHIEKRIDSLAVRITILMLGNSIIFILVTAMILVLMNPRWYSILLMLIREFQGVR